MLHPPRFPRALLLALAIPPLALAQDPPPDPSGQIERALVRQLMPEVSSRLKSERLATIAWGGWLAGEYHLEEAEDLLRDALRRLAGHPYEQRKLAVLAVLDGLVRIGSERVELSELEPHLRGITHCPALVLLARQPRRHSGALVDLYERHEDGSGLIWQACGNLLVEHAKPEFAPLVVSKLEVELQITVRDADSFSGSGSGGIRGGTGDGRLDVPEGYPPTAMYSLSDRGRAGEIVLAPGLRPIYYARKVRRGTRIGFGSSWRGTDRAPIRFEWLAALLGTSPSLLRLEPTMRDTIDVRRAEFLPAAIASRQRVLDAFAGIVARLREKRLLTDEEAAAARLEVEVRVYDGREDKSKPLPELPPIAK